MGDKTANSKMYHHGDLKAALLKAGEKVLAEKGLKGFTLRACARYAGVSHAAPAHHYKDVTGLLTAIAAQGFDRLTESMSQSMTAMPEEERQKPGSYVHAIGRGYLKFALQNPHHFRLMFQSEGINCQSPVYESASKQAFNLLLKTINDFHLVENALEEDIPKVDLVMLWSIIQGLADLYLGEQLMLESEEELECLADSMLNRMMQGMKPV